MASAKMTLSELLTRGLSALTSDDPEGESVKLLNEVKQDAHRELSAKGQELKDKRLGVVETMGEETIETSDPDDD